MAEVSCCFCRREIYMIKLENKKKLYKKKSHSSLNCTVLGIIKKKIYLVSWLLFLLTNEKKNEKKNSGI